MSSKKNDKSSIRLFESNILESFTHVHPITPLLLWTPIVLFLFYKSHTTFHHSAVINITVFVVAGLVWTLTEYVLHRYAFHYPAKSEWGKKIIYLFHGIHHDDPDDATRLVMPPLPGLLIMFMISNFFKLFVPAEYFYLFMGGFICFYLCYDYIHYATHHFRMTSKVGRYLKSYHLKHHYTKDPVKYGVSNPLWDYVFGTVEMKESWIKK
ncbi:MAG: sterol desaturase family protein [Bacteriovoracaceae bacterium]